MRVKNYDVEGLESCVGVMCVWLTGGGGWWCWGWHGNIGVIGSGDRIRLWIVDCNRLLTTLNTITDSILG